MRYSTEVKMTMNIHFKRYGFTAFKNECCMFRDEEEDELLIEWGTDGVPVHIQDYEARLSEWIENETKLKGSSLTEEELYQAEVNFNRDHIKDIVASASGGIRRR